MVEDASLKGGWSALISVYIGEVLVEKKSVKSVLVMLELVELRVHPIYYWSYAQIISPSATKFVTRKLFSLV